MSERRCWECDGRGWVPNGDIEDGMMTGRDTCPVCGGRGWVFEAEVMAEVTRLVTLPEASQ